MTQLERRPNQYAFFGTIGVWIILAILFSLSSLLPAKKVYKTVKIQLEAPAVPKIAEKQEAAPPKAEQMAPAPVSPAAAELPKAAPKQKEVSKPKEQPAKKTAAKPVEKKPAAKTAPVAKPKPAEQKLQKSMEELIAEQRAVKKPKKDFNWDDLDNDAESVESSVSATVTSAKPVDTFEGTAGSAAKAENKGANAKSSDNKKTSAVSSFTANALGTIEASTYSSTAGDGITSTSIINTASAPDGRIAMQMSDGSSRILLEPKTPVIKLSDEAAATIPGPMDLKITFTVLKNGHVDMNSITVKPDSIVPTKVRQEIAATINSWRFNADSTSATAVFDHKIRSK